MTNKRGVLLASFIMENDDQKLQEEVEFIVNNTEITNNLIFLLEDTEQPEKKIITLPSPLSMTGRQARILNLTGPSMRILFS